MKKLLIAGLAVGAVLTTFTTPASAADPEGRKCAMNSATDVTTEAGKQAAVVSAGPLAVDSGGTLTCTIIVNANTHEATGRSVSGEASDGVVAIQPTPIQYNATAADTVAVCTKWTPTGGPTRYWVSPPPPELGSWSSDVTSKCAESLTIAPNYPTCPLWLTIDKYAGTPIAETWQDCEPYEPII